MARPKKKRNGEDPGLNMRTATDIVTAPGVEGETKRYEVIAPVDVYESGSNEVIEMPADGQVDIYLTDTEAKPALESGAIRPREVNPASGLAPILIEVVAPSLNRPKEAARLEQALAACSVPEGHELKINVQRETEPRALPGIINELVAQSEASIVVVLADHIVPRPDLIEAIAKAFEGRPEVGMVGLNITNMGPLPGVREYCFFALSRPFINQFPDRQVFCPDYYHFCGDTELGRFASEVGAFAFAPDAQIVTHHVNTGLAVVDDTWRASRSRKTEDLAAFDERKARGLLWGKNFERLN